MPSTYTTSSRLEKQAAGENNNTWGTRLNDNVIALIDEAMDAVEALTVSGSVTLTTANASTDQARKRVLNCTGTGGTITIPNLAKNYLIRNATSGDITVTTGSGTTATVKAGNVQFVFSTGSNAVYTSKLLDFGSDNITTTGTGTITTIACPGTATFSRAFAAGTANITFSGTGGNFINFGTNGRGSPAIIGASGASRSVGTKVIIAAGSAAICDMAIGYGNPTGSQEMMWFSQGDSGGAFGFYGGTTLCATIDGAGKASFVGSGTNTTASAANVNINSTTGALLRSTSSIRYKANVLTLTDAEADKALNLRPVTYTSKSESDDQSVIHHGFIAEEADASGLNALVYYGDNGQPEGFQYERVIPSLISIIKRLEARVAALEA